jgi:predicted transcriptional regulator
MARKKDSLIDLWGKNAKDAGYTCVPDVLIRHLSGLNITPVEFSVLYLLLTHRKTGEYRSMPSKETIAECLGFKSKDSVRRHIKSLEEKGYIRREERRREHKKNNSNIYHFDGLAQAMKQRAAAELVDREESKRSRRRINTKLRTMPTKKLKIKERDFPKLGKDNLDELLEQTSFTEK